MSRWPENDAFVPLPYEEWADTKLTLHLWMQIVGKTRLRLAPMENHWWQTPSYVTARGLSTGPIPYRGGAFSIAFDLHAHVLRITTSLDDEREIALHEGLSVADFYRSFEDALHALDVRAPIRAEPYGGIATEPFARDTAHHSYDPAAVRRFHDVLVAVNDVMAAFRARYLGKQTPVHFFWHSFDLALTRFSGRRAAARHGVGRVEREAYSHEVISFGFWPGDPSYPQAAFYSYTAPEPAGLRDEPLGPDGAFWGEMRGGAYAFFPYAALLQHRERGPALLAFFESAYRAGATRTNWPGDLVR